MMEGGFQTISRKRNFERVEMHAVPAAVPWTTAKEEDACQPS